MFLLKNKPKIFQPHFSIDSTLRLLSLPPISIRIDSVKSYAGWSLKKKFLPKQKFFLMNFNVYKV